MSVELQTSVPAYCIQDDHIMDARDIEGRIVDLASINAQPVDSNKDEVGTLNKNMSTPTVPSETERYISARPNDDLPRPSGPALNMSWDKKNVADRTIIQRSDDVVFFFSLINHFRLIILYIYNWYYTVI